MSFLGNIFKRKPGGTFFGNLIRGAVKAVPVVGGALGNGGMMISQQDADKRDMSDADYAAKYGVQKDGKAPSVVPQMMQQLGAVAGAGIPGLQALPSGPLSSDPKTNNEALKKGANTSIASLAKKYWWIVLIPVGLTVLIVSMTRHRGSSRPRSRY